MTYGVPSRYDITLYRVSITAHGAELGWTVPALVDEVLRPAYLTLDTIPRAAPQGGPAAVPVLGRWSSAAIRRCGRR